MAHTKQLLRSLHLDTNDGDHSRVAEFTALLKRLRNVCQCWCKSPLRFGRSKFLDHLHFQMWRCGQTAQKAVCSIVLMLVVVGCSTVKQPIRTSTYQLVTPPLPITVVPRMKLLEAPTLPLVSTRLLGCAWDAPANFNPLTESFEVWATTNLTLPFALKTNTTATVVRWPMQQQEFYMVRTADIYGQKSVWATTGH